MDKLAAFGVAGRAGPNHLVYEAELALAGRTYLAGHEGPGAWALRSAHRPGLCLGGAAFPHESPGCVAKVDAHSEAAELAEGRIRVRNGELVTGALRSTRVFSVTDLARPMPVSGFAVPLGMGE